MIQLPKISTKYAKDSTYFLKLQVTNHIEKYMWLDDKET